VDPRLPELRPDLLVLDLVEAPGVWADLPSGRVPTLIGRNVTDRIDGSMIEDQPEREGVVGVDQ
jgi:hypothetical protein